MEWNYHGTICATRELVIQFCRFQLMKAILMLKTFPPSFVTFTNKSAGIVDLHLDYLVNPERSITMHQPDKLSYQTCSQTAKHWMLFTG